MNETFLQGSGKADESGDVESKPTSGTRIQMPPARKTAHNEYADLQNNEDTLMASVDDMNSANGMSVIMPKA